MLKHRLASWPGFALLALGVAAVPAQADEAAQPEATLSIEVQVDALTPGSSEGVTRSVPIPTPCTYVSHHLELLARNPESPLASRDDGTTSYRDELRRDSNGRVSAVALTLTAKMTPSGLPSSMRIRLAVAMRCAY